jgi:hypothetical protein
MSAPTHLVQATATTRLAEATAGAFRFAGRSLRSWLLFAFIAIAVDVTIPNLLPVAFSAGALIFSVWFVRFALARGGSSANDFPRRVLETFLAGFAASFLVLLAMVPALLLFMSVLAGAFELDGALLDAAGTALGDLLVSSDAVARVAGDPRLLLSALLLLPGAYLSLRLSQTTTAAIAGASPVDALRRSWAITKGALMTIIVWGVVFGLVAFGATLLLSIPIALPIVSIAASAGWTEGFSRALSVAITGGLFAPVALGFSVLLYEKLSAER